MTHEAVPNAQGAGVTTGDATANGQGQAAAQGAAAETGQGAGATANGQQATAQGVDPALRLATLEAQLSLQLSENKKLQDENAQRRIQGKEKATLEERLAQLEKDRDQAVSEARAAKLETALTGRVADARAAMKLLDTAKHVDAQGAVNVDALLADYPFLRPQAVAASARNNPGGQVGAALTAASIAAMSHEEYAKREPEIMAAMRDGRLAS